jgi:hypothetical protein
MICLTAELHAGEKSKKAMFWCHQGTMAQDNAL